MAIVQIKRVIKIGGSLAIILPSAWAKGKIYPGEEMVVIGNGELRIFPVHVKESDKNLKDVEEVKNDSKLC